jgi:hypothetical protein
MKRQSRCERNESSSHGVERADNHGYENEKALIRVRVNRLRLALTAV